jgi:hypothetical protein
VIQYNYVIINTLPLYRIDTLIGDTPIQGTKSPEPVITGTGLNLKSTYPADYQF